LSRQSYNQQYVETLFDSISEKYDLLNHLLSLGIDIIWRKKAIKLLAKFNPERILDIATGTADFAIEAMKLSPVEITGIDISEKMLEIAKKKISKRKLEDKIKLIYGKAEALDFKAGCFDAVICAFGVRNFENLEKGLKEIHRVLSDKGVFMMLEFSLPNSYMIKNVYKFYLTKVLPEIAGIVSKRKYAYEYLSKTISEFPNQINFSKELKGSGFSKVEFYPMTFGIATVYFAIKG